MKVLSCVLLLAILIEDLKFRAVHAWLFPLLFTAFVYIGLQEESPIALLSRIGFNTGLIVLNLSLATAYFNIKNRQMVSLTKGIIGWGDILFFLCLTPLFGFRLFVIAFPASLFLSLVLWLLLSASKKQAEQKVPLAGLQSLVTLCWMVLSMVGLEPKFSFLNPVV